MTFNERWFQGRLVEMSRGEALEMLGTKPVGRVCFVDQDGPVVMPVTHEVDGETIVFRTTRTGRLATSAADGPLAFQVDDIDPFQQTGWSVLVRGTAVFEELQTDDDTDGTPVPWAQGRHGLLVRIAARQVTGRRLLPT